MLLKYIYTCSCSSLSLYVHVFLHLKCVSFFIQLCEEVSRLNELKKQHMQKFCEVTRQELFAIWDQCMYGPQQRREFSAAFSGEQYISSLYTV